MFLLFAKGEGLVFVCLFVFLRKRVFDVVMLYYVIEQMRKNDVFFAMPLLLIYYEHEQYMNEIV